ncbi:hypothetical protein ACHAXA_005894 [Cyclostephanos tholiformis]|uniref:Uncharacterized protein n=1 Tax=Cyclostephanos tholiformis TaxID=382380 RepID=A0ABD3SCJ8_9STRA
MPINANVVRCRASPRGAAAAPGSQLARQHPKPAANAATWGGSALAVAPARGTAGTISKRQPFEPPPGMGGIFCLPTSEDTPAAAAAHDHPGAEGASYLFAQDSLGGGRRADAADDDSLTGTALF